MSLVHAPERAAGHRDDLKTPTTESTLWFGPTDRPLFGWVHRPADGRAIGAVVLCPPLAREWTNAHYAYRLLAEHLAAAGMLAVRFDYDGTGDSAGEDGDPARVAAWLASISAAVELARGSGCPSVSLVGMRMGALLAAVATAGTGSIDGVVLWDPCSSPRAFLREQSALHRLALDDHPVAEGIVELPGMVLDAPTAAELSSLEIPEVRHPPARVLLLTRPGRQPQVDLAGALGAEITEGPALGQERLLDVDLAEREIPMETMGHIVSWLATPNPGPVGPVVVPRRESARIGVAGTSVTEQTVRIGPAGLFGIVTDPDDPRVSTTVLMLNSGNNSHVGPSRLWVDLARRWASMGVRCVRFDESGLGDSPTRPGQAPQVIRAPENFDDVEDARRALCADPADVAVVGLCSGGYQALEAALARPLRAVCAINPILHFTPPELAHGPMDPRRRICWPVGSFVGAYRLLAVEPVRRQLSKAVWRVAHLLHRRRNPAEWLDRLRAEAVDVLILCGVNEARSFGVEAYDTLATSDGDRVQIEVIEGLDHALVPAWQRADVASRMTEHLEKVLFLADPPAANDAGAPVHGPSEAVGR